MLETTLTKRPLTSRVRGLGKKMKATGQNPRIQRRSAYTLVEVLVASVIVGTMVISLYAAFSAGFAVVRASREKTRATQILLQKLETIRFCNWSQLQSVPANFEEPFDPRVTNSGPNAFYYGDISFGPAGMIPDTAPYKTNMQQVTVTVHWTNDNGLGLKPFSEQLTTVIARYGAQNLAFGK